MNREEFLDLLRMWPTLLVALITVAMVYVIAPQQIGILVYTIAKLSMAGYLGYWLDRWIFPLDRVGPTSDERNAPDQTAAQYRRAGIIAACLVASGLMS